MVGIGFARTGAAQHRLIGHDQPILVHRHIFGGEDRQHAWQRLGGMGIQPGDAGVWPAGKEDLHMGHVGP